MNFPLVLSPEAVERLRHILATKGQPGQFIRIGVKGGGCSGFEYFVRLDERTTPYDIEMEFEGLRVVSDTKSQPYLEGATLRYTGNLLGGGFQFDNPNAARSCGCGSSFTPKAG